MKRHLIIVDPVAATPYTEHDLLSQPLGGTEATVLRISKALSSDWNVIVAQACRTEVVRTLHATYVPYDHKHFQFPSDPDVVIALRCSKILKRLRRKCPTSDLYLWMHCLPGRQARQLATHCQQTKTEIVTVSDYHRQQVEKHLRQYPAGEGHAVTVHRIYNPVIVPRFPEPHPVRPMKLICMSSAHKGLDQVLANFSYCRQSIPRLQLAVADPGYFKTGRRSLPDGCEWLGPLSHERVLRELQTSFCLFYPQNSFAETFGLVVAEANALGVPVLAGNIGATSEIITGSAEQIIDDLTPENVLMTLRFWQEHGRPEVTPNPEFDLQTVVSQWQTLLVRQLSQSRRRNPHVTSVS